MFYKTGIDITKDRQMFNFLKHHFGYYTMNPWNRLSSIANNVKLYQLGLTGDWTVAAALLNAGEYNTIHWMIEDWRQEHNGYAVYFNGRSNGYLVLMEEHSNSSILPEAILECDTYEDYKEYCKENYGSVKANHSDLVYYTKLVQDFDKLCDMLRDYCDQLSNLSFEITEMQKTVDCFNEQYADDLELLGFKHLCCMDTGKVDVSEIVVLSSLFEAFVRVANRLDNGYVLKSDENGFIQYVRK